MNYLTVLYFFDELFKMFSVTLECVCVCVCV